MKKITSILLMLLLFVISTVATSFAGPRHHGSSYRSHYYSGPHFSYRPHHRSHRSHYYHSSHFWTNLGVGFLTGAVVGSIINQPSNHRTVVYNTPPPVIVQSRPTIVGQQYGHPLPQPVLVLRRVEATAQLLNVRSGPGLDMGVTGQVKQGALLDVIGAAPEWLYIKTETGQYGWVMKQYTHGAESPVG